MIERSRTWILPSLILAGIAGIAACSSGHTDDASANSSQSLTVQLGRPSWATSDRLVGNVDANETVSLQIHLKMRNQDMADAQLAAISDPERPEYGQFITDEEFNAKYAPTDADVAAVRAHVESHGMKVTEVPDNKAYVSVTGTAAQVQHAFAAKLGMYKVGEETRRAPIDMPMISQEMSNHVLTVLGLAESRMTTHRGVRTGGIKQDSIKTLRPHQASPNDVPANTCSEWAGAIPDTVDPAYGPDPLTYLQCGYHPAQLRQAYGFADSIRKGNDGKGQTIAIVDAFTSPTLVQDAQTYAAQNDGDYPLATSQITLVQGPGTPQTPDPGWYGEATLDVEAVHAMAPGAKIVFVGAQSPTDTDLVGAINLIVSKRLATIVSNSYGSPEGGQNNFLAWHSIATQAGLKGVGLYFSSGDNGDESAHAFMISADFPASLDNVTAVGGTSMALDRTGQIAWEVGWETAASFLTPATAADADAGTPATPASWAPAAPGSYFFGSGGGTSLVYAQPSWQKNIVPPALANIPGVPARVVPDVSMVGDPYTGFFIGQTDPSTGKYGESEIGGTSLSCPLFAGVMALAQQHAGKKFGFSNAVLYKASKKAAFRDITPSDKLHAVAMPGGIAVTFDYAGADLSIKTAVGYDNVTGLGAPNGAKFLAAVK